MYIKENDNSEEKTEQSIFANRNISHSTTQNVLYLIHPTISNAYMYNVQYNTKKSFEYSRDSHLCGQSYIYHG